MDFPVGEFDQIGNLAAHIEGRVEFDRTLRRAELRPGKKTETEVDRRGVDGTEFVLERERLHVPIGFVLSNKRFKAVLREQMQHLLQDCGSVGHTKKGGSVRLLTRLRCRPFSLWARAGFQIRSKFLWTVVIKYIYINNDQSKKTDNRQQHYPHGSNCTHYQ